MPSAISKKTPKSTLRTSSRTKTCDGKLLGRLMTTEESDGVLRKYGARPATVEEIKRGRKAEARTKSLPAKRILAA
jgi:hypothetical protein